MLLWRKQEGFLAYFYFFVAIYRQRLEKMSTNYLSLQELETHQQRLNQEIQEDRLAIDAGRLSESEAIKRSVYRDFEQRWLEMETILLNSNTFATQQ